MQLQPSKTLTKKHTYLSFPVNIFHCSKLRNQAILFEEQEVMLMRQRKIERINN